MVFHGTYFSKYLNSLQFLRLDHHGVKLEVMVGKIKHNISTQKQYNQKLVSV
ncbi:Mobile element protein [Candidatus Enterovibrio escicola]|uniref:Mobile element protein n=1 Tax=Candidatus Enterovibrio escicola TaxID=1927127 RepID=A0A2A5T7H6_9GAMM|nr:Mobile element protein [Candidatus Enterovibrio escacola]